MDVLKPEELWFNTPDSNTLCRAGGNGPNHPSQLYAIRKYVKDDMTFLDYGAGSGTTLEALETAGLIKIAQNYTGLDIIPKNVTWCQEQWPLHKWKVNKQIHKIDEPDKSYDVVYSRHVVDHMKSFEDAMDEHKRVARKLVIVVLWAGLVDRDTHDIKNIVDQRGLPTEKLFPQEYTNNYSFKLVMDYLVSDPEWQLRELSRDVGSEVSGHDDVIVLEHE